MLAIARALMADPSLLMLEETSLGLAPLLVVELFEIIKCLNIDFETAVLLIQQNAKRALSIADHAYMLEKGRILLEGGGR